MSNVVGLVKADISANLKDSISQVLDLIGFKASQPVKTVVLKPNLCYYWDASTGYTTDPRIVSGIIDYVREKFGDVDIKIAEADASAMRTKYVFPVLGYDILAKEKKVELFNLSSDVLLDKTVCVRGQDISFKVPETLTKCDLFINVPKLKIMKATKITCAMKNIFGCIGFPRKMVYHKNLNEAIVGINKILQPHVTIVDGLVGLGRFPVKLGLILGALNVFSVDWVACKIMGYRPSSVDFLKVAIEEKLGNPGGIAVRGEDLETFAKNFPKETFLSSKYLWNFELWLLNAYRKVSGDVIPPFLE
jgi:uncharacterized protein (DUF362 family)